MSQAVEAIRAFNGYNWNNYQLEVKFADQDAGPPTSGNQAHLNFVQCAMTPCSQMAGLLLSCWLASTTPISCHATGSGGTPSDNLYIRVSCLTDQHLPDGAWVQSSAALCKQASGDGPHCLLSQTPCQSSLGQQFLGFVQLSLNLWEQKLV